MHNRVSTGIRGIDEVVDGLRLGDNVVWQVDETAQYAGLAARFAAQAERDGRKLIYVRFGRHEPLLQADSGVQVVELKADRGFERFAASVHRLIGREGRRAFYVFDCLTDLLADWHSDLMIGNFFRVTCPYLFELETVAYFAIIRNAHTFATIAGIRETTQLLIDVYRVGGRDYIHPLKAWNRYTPVMFFPHRLDGDEAVSITSSAEAAELFAAVARGEDRLDYWNVMFAKAKEALGAPAAEQERVKMRLLRMLAGREARLLKLCGRYFTLADVLRIAERQIGSGYIGGKSVGMLLARRILEAEGGERFTARLEPHDSWYIGSDVFYTYIVHNGWWKLFMRQKTKEGYFGCAAELREKLLTGRFPENIRERFMRLLEHYGQSPIIVRSSSLLEDRYGNAFAGKYESVFCVNRGTPEERYEAFERAVRIVYASAMNEDALVYRQMRGLSGEDEQMALLVQRVSGDEHGDGYFPHAAGVGHSTNLYVWDPDIDMNAGMLRLVFGLGTRAVDRTEGDYARIVCLDDPKRLPPMHAGDRRKYAQHEADLLSFREGGLVSRDVNRVLAGGIKADRTLIAEPDEEAAARLRELGLADRPAPWIVDFRGLLERTDFPAFMREMMARLAAVYAYPVDIEFTVNFRPDGGYRVNLLQCRPLATRGPGRPVELPEPSDDCFFASRGGFMGGNVRLPVEYVVYVRPDAYFALPEQGKHAVARLIGRINRALKGRQTMLVGPGRWGTTTPSLGVPVHFAEICHAAVLCEVAEGESGIAPELSYGSHFFLDLVETGIFYVALMPGEPDVVWHPERVLELPNALIELVPEAAPLAEVVHAARTEGMELFADIGAQRVVCRAGKQPPGRTGDG
jgi:hypothetical protein